jgi:hypothetical protein
MSEESARGNSSKPQGVRAMDAKSTRVEAPGNGRTDKAAPEKPIEEFTRLRSDIEDARDGLGPYVAESERRRQQALELQSKLKKHRVGIGVGVATVAAVASAVALVVQSRRHAAQMSPWAAWRDTDNSGSRSSRLGQFLLGTAIPVALSAARGLVERSSQRRLHLA